MQFPTANIGIIRTMKTLAIHLRLETASHRRRMMGIFRRIGATDKFDIRIIPDEDTLCGMVASENPAGRPDGIISCVPYSGRTKAMLAASGLPFVGIGMSNDDIAGLDGNSGFVMNDNDGIGQAAAEHLLSLGGFRSFAYVPDTRGRAWSALRGSSFAATLRTAGKDCETYGGDGGDTAALSAFLASLPRPAAVMAAWDGRAADVIHAAHKARLAVPDDIAILGVDDDELICEHTAPPLSSVKTDAEGMGEAAAQMMISLLSGKANRHARSKTCPVLGVTERQSTNTPAPAAAMIDRAMAFITAEATNGIGPEEVAKYLRVSRRLLDLRFRQFESKSVSRIIVEKKLESAMRLLAETDISVKNAFAQSGFGDISYATKLFKNTTGASPKTWRSKNSATAANGEASARKSGFLPLSDLTPTDESDLKRLVGQLSPDAATDFSALRSSIMGGTTSVFVLRRSSRIVASATAVRFSTPTGSHCRIEDVVVDERMRGRGLGREIMEKTLDALRAMNVSHIELTSHPSRVAARALYRSLGFKPRKTGVFELRLSATVS